MTSSIKSVVIALDRWVYRASWVLTGLTLVVMFAVVMAVVFTRYVIDLPFFWGEEFARFCMFYMICLGSAVALREGGHIRLTIFADMLSGSYRRALEFFIDLLVLGVVITMFWHGLDLAVFDGDMRTPVLRWKYFWIWLGFPIGAALSVLLLLGKQFAPPKIGNFGLGVE